MDKKEAIEILKSHRPGYAWDMRTAIESEAKKVAESEVDKWFGSVSGSPMSQSACLLYIKKFLDDFGLLSEEDNINWAWEGWKGDGSPKESGVKFETKNHMKKFGSKFGTFTYWRLPSEPEGEE